MLRFVLLSIGLLVSAISYCQRITFVSQDSIALPEVRCVGFTAQNDSIFYAVSRSNGIVNIPKGEVSRIVASHEGFRDKIIFMDKLVGDANTVIMLPPVALQEVVVTPKDVKEFATHTSYRISQKDMGRYPTVLQALNEIPNITVLSNGMLFFEGDENVKILIDGVDATTSEVQTLSKEDISKVDVYQIPPLRFIAQGVDAVLDIRLKSKIHGGNGAVDITQAFQSLKGDNMAALYYNFKQSRFSLRYNNENTHYRKSRQSEVLDYDFGGVRYNKEKRGLDSKEHYDDNSLNLTYQINKPKNFLYNIKSGLAFNRNGVASNQDVTTGTQSFLATNRLRTNYTKYIVGNYIEKNLGDRFGILLANVNYQRFSTSYNSAYNELSDDANALRDSHSKYKTNLDAVFSELQYQLPYTRAGQFSFSAYEVYKHSEYVDAVTPFNQTVNTLGGQAQWMWMKGNVRWWLTCGAIWYHTNSTNLSKPHNLSIPTPNANVSWRLNGNAQFVFSYSYSGGMPTIAQLSETNQWLDTRLVYHGNSTLKPYKIHSAGVRFVWNIKYLNLSLSNAFSSSPNMICDMYTLTDKYMLQTLVNLSKYRIFSSQLDLSVKPLGNNKLVFWNRIILADLNGENKEYSWNGYRFQWMSTLALNLTNWTVQLFYQYPGKIVEGQLERPRAQCWSATVLYRPQTNLSLGLTCFMPFGKGFKESEHTVNSAPVYADTEYKIMDRNNMLSLKLSYNFSFGRNRNIAQPQYDNYDNDSGILHK